MKKIVEKSLKQIEKSSESFGKYFFEKFLKVLKKKYKKTQKNVLEEKFW